jgi:transmembrane sensor
VALLLGDLFNRLLEGELSPNDTDEIIAWLGKEDLDPQMAEQIMQQLKQSVAAEEIDPKIIQALETRLPEILAQPKTTPARLRILQRGWFKYSAAAVIILLLGTAAYLLIKPRQVKDIAIANPHPVKKEITPGKTGAILTLDDGSSVVLDSLGNGLVATQNGSKIMLRNGQLLYNTGGSSAAGISYNTMTTPKGRQFQLVLPDGSKVWLNAESSIRYPVAFTGNERKVEITGEAYFEVEKNPAMPFRVKMHNETEIEVLGTHFNINSYADEASINTTLLEGSVKVFSGNEKVILKPGQQAQVETQQNAPIKIVKEVNLDKVMAWKNGVFDFQDATLQEVMRQLARWYDIEVVYEKGVPSLEFMGTMGRDLSLPDVLKGLKLSEVHCRIEGRKLIVTP